MKLELWYVYQLDLGYNNMYMHPCGSKVSYDHLNTHDPVLYKAWE